jgi:hypothetical protein
MQSTSFGAEAGADGAPPAELAIAFAGGPRPPQGSSDRGQRISGYEQVRRGGAARSSGARAKTSSAAPGPEPRERAGWL